MAWDTEDRMFIVYWRASMHNAEQGDLSSDTMDTLRRSKTPNATYRDQGQWKLTSKHKFVFMISICSQQCNYSVKRQRFYCFKYFAQNADIHMSGKWRNSTIDPVWEVNYLCYGQLSTSRFIKIVIKFQQHFCLQHREQRISLFQKIGKLIRSNADSKWQACLRETDADRSWQAGHEEPWTSKRDEQGRSNARHSCLVTALKKQSTWRTWRRCARTFHWKSELRFGRWGFKSGDTQKRKHSVCASFSKNQERSILRTEKVWWLCNSRAQNPQRRMWISEQSPIRCRGTSSRYNPCQTKTSQEMEKNLRKFL